MIGTRRGRVILKKVCFEVAPSIEDASKRLWSIPIIPAIRRMVVLPNHIRKLINAMIDLVAQTSLKNRKGSAC